MNNIRETKLDVKQNELGTSIVGVDLAQTNFVASCKGWVKRFKDDDMGIDAMLKWAEQRSADEQLIVCFESTSYMGMRESIGLQRAGADGKMPPFTPKKP